MRLTIALIVGLTSTSAIEAAAPSMSTSWSDLNVPQAECVSKGTKAMRGAGLTENFEVVGDNTIYGESGDYTAAIRCAEGKTIVIFIVAGPEVQKCRSFREAMKKIFEE